MGRSQTAKGMRLLRKLTAELRMLIAGDIGGIKTNLAIYSSESGPHSPLAQTERHSADYPSLQAMVVEFLRQVKLSLDVTSIDVAGPVIDWHVQITQFTRVIDGCSV